MADQKQTNRERLWEITEGIEQGIKDLFQSDKYMQYLRVMSRFHHYSVNNVMLIHMQKPDATQVAGFNKWRDQFGRHVKRGEKGIKIIAPTPYKKKVEEIKRDPDTKAPILDKDGKAIVEEKEVQIPMFKVVSVFDVSQTGGRPLPQLASDLTGNVQHYEIFMEALRRSSPVPMELEPMAANMDGFFDTENQRIAIRTGMSEVQTISAAIHEITHAKLHNPEKTETVLSWKVVMVSDGGIRHDYSQGFESEAAAEAFAADAGWRYVDENRFEWRLEVEEDISTVQDAIKSRNTEEVEAESVSYAVCQYYGIQTGENSFGYIASWSRGKELSELRASLETINKTANGLITDVDRYFAEICKERGVDLTAEASVQEAPQVSDSAELSKTAAEPQSVSQQMQSEVAQWEDDHVQDISASVQTVKAPVEQETPSPENQVSPASMLPDAPEQVLDEYPMPDEVLQAADLEACGYMDGDMLPLSKERALELYDMDLTVYAIVSGGSAEMLFDQEEFETQAPGTVFAVSREEWEQSPMFHEKIMERQQHQEEREAAFLTYTGDCFAIYQVSHEDPNNVRFMNMDWMQSHGLAIERGNYDLIYTGQLTEKGTTEQKLEMLYETFNLHHPADYHSPSLSASDIVAVKQNGVVSCHYCDSVGFQELSGFLPHDNPLKNAEMSVEDDYGMIDGIINNGPRQTVAGLEQQARSGQPISLMDLAEAVHREDREKKKSVMEQLHSQPKQDHKKTAPKKSAEREI